mgnify:CR=1 FL=1
MRSFEFMRALPAAIEAELDPQWQHFKHQARAWLVQLYYARPDIHYEVWHLGQQRSSHPQGSLEIGLHFESRTSAENSALLLGFQSYLGYIKHTLGPRWEAEAWDKGWAKVYTTLPHTGFTPENLTHVAQVMAAAMGVLQPILEAQLQANPSLISSKIETNR